MKIDQVPVSLSRDVQREILSKRVGQNVQLEVWRNGKTAVVSLQTGEQPDRITLASNRRAPSEPQPEREPKVGNHGLETEDVAPAGTGGVRVVEVRPGSPADAAGLIAGDVITEIAGKPVKGKAGFEAALAAADPARGLMLMVNREGQKTFAILKP